MADTATLTAAALISADKVKGTDVYDLAGEKLGSIDDIMIDKTTGRAVYAIMAFGGLLGMGQHHHPLPWATLKYDAAKEGYVVDLDPAKLEGAPSHDSREPFYWTPDYGRRVDSFYGVPSYWV